MASVVIDSAFWTNLEARFRALLGRIRLVGIWTANGWSISTDGPEDREVSRQLRDSFITLARRAAIAAGTPNRTNARDAWLELLREDSPHFHPIESKRHEGGIDFNDPGGWIQDLALASAEYCAVRATRVFELQNIAAAGPAGLRRDRYPFRSRLYDHAHQALANPAEELAYWRAHLWRRFHDLVESYVKTGEALAVQESAALRSPESNQLRAVWEERDDKLGEAIAGLIYDLAVLEANSVIDLGLRGDGAAQAFRRRVEDLREQVTSEWRASCARLAITAREEDERWKAWLGALERVGRDLQSLQPYLPQPGPEAESTASGSDKAGLMNRAPKRGPRPDYEMAARIHEIVKAVAPNGNWLARLDEVCEALDEANIPCPKAWRRRDPPSRSWSTCDERAIRIKAIQYRMEQAKRATETQPKT